MAGTEEQPLRPNKGTWNWLRFVCRFRTKLAVSGRRQIKWGCLLPADGTKREKRSIHLLPRPVIFSRYLQVLSKSTAWIDQSLKLRDWTLNWQRPCPLASSLFHHGDSAEGHGGPRESERFLRLGLHNIAAKAVHQATGVEIQNQPDVDSAHDQVGMQLRFVHRQDRCDGFDLQ